MAVANISQKKGHLLEESLPIDLKNGLTLRPQEGQESWAWGFRNRKAAFGQVVPASLCGLKTEFHWLVWVPC